MIRVPKWVQNRLGEYYIYFADHKGQYIRLAYADRIKGPWTIYEPGSLQLSQSNFCQIPPESTSEMIRQLRERSKNIPFSHDVALDATTPHIASPDVHVDEAGQNIVMYFHGLESFSLQVTRAAISKDGISFTTNDEILGRSYMRVFHHDGYTYAMSMPGQFYRSDNGITDFTPGPMLFDRNMRHAGLLLSEQTLCVFWTKVGDTPERIYLSTIDVSGDWLEWQESEPREILRPETEWEGANAALKPSVRSVAYGEVNQLRDPAVFVEDDKYYLLYAIAGESGIGLAALIPD